MSAIAFPEDIPEELQPTSAQLAVWGPWVAPELGVDEYGMWSGWCPLHDPDGHDPEATTAKYLFMTNNFRCEFSPPCHAPKKGMTLTNLAARMVATGVIVRGMTYTEAARMEKNERKRKAREERELLYRQKVAAAEAKYAKPSSLKSHTDAE